MRRSRPCDNNSYNQTRSSRASSRDRTSYKRQSYSPCPASQPRPTYVPCPASPPQQTYEPCPAAQPRETYVHCPASPAKQTYEPSWASQQRQTYAPCSASTPKQNYEPCPASQTRQSYETCPASQTRQRYEPCPASQTRVSYESFPAGQSHSRFSTKNRDDCGCDTKSQASLKRPKSKKSLKNTTIPSCRRSSKNSLDSSNYFYPVAANDYEEQLQQQQLPYYAIPVVYVPPQQNLSRDGAAAPKQQRICGLKPSSSGYDLDSYNESGGYETGGYETGGYESGGYETEGYETDAQMYQDPYFRRIYSGTREANEDLTDNYSEAAVDDYESYNTEYSCECSPQAEEDYSEAAENIITCMQESANYEGDYDGCEPPPEVFGCYNPKTLDSEIEAFYEKHPCSTCAKPKRTKPKPSKGASKSSPPPCKPNQKSKPCGDSTKPTSKKSKECMQNSVLCSTESMSCACESKSIQTVICRQPTRTVGTQTRVPKKSGGFFCCGQSKSSTDSNKSKKSRNKSKTELHNENEVRHASRGSIGRVDSCATPMDKIRFPEPPAVCGCQPSACSTKFSTSKLPVRTRPSTSCTTRQPPPPSRQSSPCRSRCSTEAPRCSPSSKRL